MAFYKSRRSVLTYILAGFVLLLLLVSLRVSFREDGDKAATSRLGSGRKTAEKHAANLGHKGGEAFKQSVGGNTEHHEKFLMLNYMTYLGLNNLRYEIEHHAYYAYMMNRTLIVPSNIHMRGCYHPGMCAIEGYRVRDKSDQEATMNKWAMPIHNFFDLAHLRKHVKILTVAEFLQLQLDRNPSLKQIQSALTSFTVQEDIAMWGHHIQAYVPDLTFQSINMFDFLHRQAPGIVTVDDTRPILDQFRARVGFSPSSPDTDPDLLMEELARVPDTLDATLWGYIDIPNMAIDQEYNVSVEILPPREWQQRDPSRQWDKPPQVSVDPARKSRNAKYLKYEYPIGLVGLKQRFMKADLKEKQIIHLGGKAHDYGYHPVKFTSPEGRKLYDKVCLEWVRYAKPVWETYEYVKDKMDWLTEERPYLTFHLRRGDFSKYGWNGATLPDPNNLIAAYQRTVADLTLKYKTLVLDKWESARLESERRLTEWKAAVAQLEIVKGVAGLNDNPIPTPVRPAPFMLPSPLPLSPYTFIATDEDDQNVVERLNALNGTMLFNLLSDGHDGDKENFYDHNYQLAVFGDWMGMVDQLMCRDGWWFVGSYMSSFTGGVFNMRKGLGLDERLTCYISDYE